MGRVRGERWGPRVIDLDLLLHSDEIINKERLKVPHPSMHERRFVLQPLFELNCDLVHPVMKKTVKQLLKELKEAGGHVKKFEQTIC